MRPWTLAAWILILLCAILGVIHSTARAAEYMEPTHFSVEAYKIANMRDAYIPEYSVYTNDPEYWTHGAAVNWDLDLVRQGDWIWFWRNRVHEAATNKQVRQVGWRWDLGINWRNKIEFSHEHHSQHVLDRQGNGFYPNIDQYAVRFILIP